MDKINVAELLKDCPKGMELDCTMFNGVYFDHVDESRLNRIKCYVNNGNEHFEIEFEESGQYISNDSAKCVIFPKGKTTWCGFQRPFKDGDILYMHASNSWIFIYREGGEKENIYYKYVAITEAAERLHFVHDSFPLCHLNLSKVKEIRHATEEEKQELFQAIKANGYKWNAETKTLEKLIEPKFKVGDRVRNKDDKTIMAITGIKDNYYFVQFYNIKRNDYQNEKISFKDQDKYELDSHKFDINTLKPFESKVLVRDDGYSLWQPSLWGLYDKKHRFPYVTIGCRYKQCIPYEGNEHLLGKTNDCNEYFKTWE